MVHRINMEYILGIQDYMFSFNSDKVGTIYCFFSNIPLKKTPYVLNSIIKEKEFSLSLHRIGFYKGTEFEERFNEPNLDIKSDEIQIRCGEETESIKIYKLSLFYNLALEYVHNVLEAVTWFDLLEKDIVDKKWVNELKKWIIENEGDILKMQNI